MFSQRDAARDGGPDEHSPGGGGTGHQHPALPALCPRSPLQDVQQDVQVPSPEPVFTIIRGTITVVPSKSTFF